MISQVLFLNIFKSCLHTAMALGPQRSNSFAVSLAKMDLVPGGFPARHLLFQDVKKRRWI